MPKTNQLILALILIMASCQLPQNNPSQKGKPGALYTEAAQTLAARGFEAGSRAAPGTPSDPSISQEGTPSPNSSPDFSLLSLTPESVEGDSDGPCDQVKFIKDVTIPDEMDLAPGERFTKTWRIQNAGSCPWTLGYLLYFESGDLMGGPSSLELTSAAIQPGEILDISVDLVAPQQTGIYQGNWKLRNVKGDGFGVGEFSKAFWVKINVVEGAGMMLDFNNRADDAAWGSGKTPVDYIDLGGSILNFDDPAGSEGPYVALLDQQGLEGGRISGVLLATYPPPGKGSYIIGRFPDYKVNGGDLLFGRVGLTAKPNGSCGDGNVDFRIHLMRDGDPSTMVMLWEWNEICDGQLKSFEIDLDDYKGESAQIFLLVIANSNSSENLAVWDSLSIHR